MANVTVVVGRWLAHTRFVPTPLYRLILMAAVVSAVLQLGYGAPDSVSQTSQSSLFDWAFVGFQLVGAVSALCGLYLVEGELPAPWVVASGEHPAIDPSKLQRSLTLELFGLILLQTVMAVQIVASTAYAGRIPSALSTWMVMVFWAWSFFRDRDIIRALRRLTR